MIKEKFNNMLWIQKVLVTPKAVFFLMQLKDGYFLTFPKNKENDTVCSNWLLIDPKT